MFGNKTKVLRMLSQDIVDRAGGAAGKATSALKRPASLQIVLRALIGEGLRRDDDGHLLANIEGQARAVRRVRSLAGGRGGAEAERASPWAGALRRPGGREGERRRSEDRRGHPPTGRVRTHA